MRIGIVAPSTPIAAETADAARAVAAAYAPGTELVFHPQCFVRHRHFAGDDRTRAEAFLAIANDPGFDAVWFARGGYGSGRIAEEVVARLESAAGDKAYLGYSDAGFLLAALYKAGVGRVAHGPMPQDALRDGGARAVRRALDWLERGDGAALEPSIVAGVRHVAFNLTVLSQLLGTALEPDLSDHVLMLEEVSEHSYRTDRAMFHVTGQPSIRRVAGIRIGRCSLVPENDPDFGESEADIARHWCGRAGIPFLGIADIGHDSDNKVVPFGLA